MTLLVYDYIIPESANEYDKEAIKVTYEGLGKLRHNGAWYHISPWGLSWDDENYYLVGYDSDAEKIKHYRVDKMLTRHCKACGISKISIHGLRHTHASLVEY